MCFLFLFGGCLPNQKPWGPRTIARSNVAPADRPRQSYISEGERWLLREADGGMTVTLDDHSVWKLDPYTGIDAPLWLPLTSFLIRRAAAGTSLYRYEFRSTSGNNSVYARPLYLP